MVVLGRSGNERVEPSRRSTASRARGRMGPIASPPPDIPRDNSPVSHPNEAVIRRVYEAINSGNIAALVSEFDPDAVWHGSESAISGASAISALVAQLREASDGTLRMELHDVLRRLDQPASGRAAPPE
jgi:hypothetical protein